MIMMRSSQQPSCSRSSNAVAASSATFRPRALNHRAMIARASASASSTPTATTSSAKPAEVVTVTWRQNGKSTEAKSGEDLLEATERCGADISTGCFSGSCGVCEVELHKFDADGKQGGSVVVRACIAKVPRGYPRIEIAPMPDDMVWGQDGFDT